MEGRIWGKICKKALFVHVSNDVGEGGWCCGNEKGDQGADNLRSGLRVGERKKEGSVGRNGP